MTSKTLGIMHPIGHIVPGPSSLPPATDLSQALPSHSVSNAFSVKSRYDFNRGNYSEMVAPSACSLHNIEFQSLVPQRRVVSPLAILNYGLSQRWLLPLNGSLSRSQRGSREATRRWRDRGGALRCRASADQPALDESLTLTELPCLPFSPAEGLHPIHQVFVPASTKTLHLYEARFLALLDEVTAKTQNLFAHVVIQPVMGSNGVVGSSMVASYGCLAQVEQVRRGTVGALVTVRGIGRIKLVGITQLEPFLKGTVIPVKDAAPRDEASVAAAVGELRAVLSDVQTLQIKLKSSADEPLQTPLERALEWADKAGRGEEAVGTAYLPSLAERITFAALQPVTGASAAELHRLLQLRLTSMESVDTLQRLEAVSEHAKETRSALAAKVALQGLQL